VSNKPPLKHPKQHQKPPKHTIKHSPKQRQKQKQNPKHQQIRPKKTQKFFSQTILNPKHFQEHLRESLNKVKVSS
jgi:hypothetical protein